MKAELSKEKFSNSWKNKLEETAGLQHASLQNKDVAWEKLHARLHKKLQRKSIVWYWFAAACVLLAIIIPLFTIHKAIPEIAQKNIPTNETKKHVTKKDETIKSVITEKNMLQVQQPLQKNTVAKNYTMRPAVPDTAQNATFTMVYNGGFIDETVAKPAIDTNAIAAIAIILPERKLKVVHVNELGEPAEFPIDVAHSTDLHLFQLKLAQQEIYNASSIATNSNSVISLKPKNFPK